MQVRHPHKLLVLGVAVLGLIAAFASFKRSRVRASADEPRSTAIPYAAVTPVTRQTVATSLAIAGQFIPYQNVELHAKVAGYIRNIYVDIGDRVHKGQVLAVLEVPELV